MRRLSGSAAANRAEVRVATCKSTGQCVGRAPAARTNSAAVTKMAAALLTRRAECVRRAGACARSERGGRGKTPGRRATLRPHARPGRSWWLVQYPCAARRFRRLARRSCSAANARGTDASCDRLFAGEPDRVAALVVRAMDRRRPMVYAPPIWAWVMLVIRWLPRFVMRRIGF